MASHAKLVTATTAGVEMPFSAIVKMTTNLIYPSIARIGATANNRQAFTRVQQADFICHSEGIITGAKKLS